jgi:hypothetical protein
MCYCNPSIRTPFCGAPGCQWPTSAAHSIDTAANNDRTIIAIDFPLDDKDIIKIMKGNEYSLYKMISPRIEIRVKVFSSDRVKNISWENWRLLTKFAWEHPELRSLIKKIESEE